uniref:Uncharacterized protein n=1 Tax=Anguilla anguilla TaxID=7936 RepID=A0A0E9VF21_ANGAN
MTCTCTKLTTLEENLPRSHLRNYIMLVRCWEAVVSGQFSLDNASLTACRWPSRKFLVTGYSNGRDW